MGRMRRSPSREVWPREPHRFSSNYPFNAIAREYRRTTDHWLIGDIRGFRMNDPRPGTSKDDGGGTFAASVACKADVVVVKVKATDGVISTVVESERAAVGLI